LIARSIVLNKHYLAWVVVAGLAVAGVLVYAVVYIPEKAYRGSIKLACVPDYTHGFLLYTRPGEELAVTLECDGSVLVNLTFVGGVNKASQLSCGGSVSVKIVSGGVTFVYARVASCEGGSQVWVRVRRR